MFSAYKNKNQLLGFLTSRENDRIKLFIVDSITEKTIFDLYYETEKVETFFSGFATLNFGGNIFKGFIVDIFEIDFKATKYGISYNFCEALQKKFNQFKIPYYFITRENYFYSFLLTATEMIMKLDEILMIVIPFKSHLTVGEFKFTQNGYKLIQQKVFKFDLKSKPETLKQQILGSSNPKKIIFAAEGCKKFPYKKVFKSMKYVILMGCLECHPEKFVVETGRWFADKSYVKYRILPTSVKSLHVYGCFGSKSDILDIVDIKINDQLPISKTVYFSKSIPFIIIVYKDGESTWCRTDEMEKDCHKYKITVTIDENNMGGDKIEKLYMPNFEKFPSTINALSESKIPFIGFFNNSSVVAVHREFRGYKFLRKCNGQFGEEIYISFDQKKPKFGKAAMEVLEKKRGFVVFDLLKIMSMPPENVKAEKHWGFKITKDAENPVLVDFNNFCGARRAATPSFLMALFLRQYLNVVRIEIGEKPKKVALWILKEFEEEELERIRKGIGEACKLLELDFIFVDSKDSDLLKVWK